MHLFDLRDGVEGTMARPRILRWLGFSSVEGDRRLALRRSPGPAAALAVGGAVMAGGKRAQRRAGLRPGMRRVSATATSAAAALVSAAVRRDLPGRELREQAVRADEERRTAAEVDLAVPLVGSHAVLFAELVIVAFEWAFWFSTWSDPIDPRVPWYGPARLSAALLALLTPLLGVLGARLGGGAAHRVLRACPGVGRADRIGMWVGLGFAVAAVVVIGVLAYWRFDATAAGIGAVVPPAWAMATLFGLVVVLDVLLRAFGVSERHVQRRHRRRDVVRDRRSAARAESRVLRADRRARAAWQALRYQVQLTLEVVDLITVTGDELILDARNAAADTAASAPSVAAEPAASHAHAVRSGYRLPSGQRQRVLAGPHHVPFDLRLIADAIDVLDVHPPAGMSSSQAMVEQLRRRLAGLTPEPAAPTTLSVPLDNHRVPDQRGFAHKVGGGE